MGYPGRFTRAFILLLAGLLVSGLTHAQSREPLLPKDARPAKQALYDRVQAGETVRVLVQLREALPDEIAGDVGDASKDPVSRNIAIVQQLFMDELATVKKSTPLRTYSRIPFMLLEVDAEILNATLKSEYVVGIYEDEIYSPMHNENIAAIGADAAWEYGGSGEGQVVAILDTGVDVEHPYLKDKLVHGACFSSNYKSLSGDFESISTCPGKAGKAYGVEAGADCGRDVSGCDHGTRVAGIAAGRADTFSGVARDASLMSVQVFSRFESYCGNIPCARSWVSDQITGLEYIYAVSDSLHIAAVNMSLGGGHYTSQERCDSVNPAMFAMFAVLYDAGIPVIAAAGNSGLEDGLVAPACLSNSISVGSTTLADKVSTFSSSANFLDFLAPGEGIVSSVPGGEYEAGSGTSFSAPHVAGAWAILKASSPGASVEDLKKAFTNTGVGILDSRNNLTKPRIQVDMALQFALLPVDLVRFEAITNGTETELQWETISETNNAGFEIQHNFGAGFRTVDFLPGGGTRTGAFQYSYRIDELQPGVHTFRLKQIDFDGTHAFTQSVETYVELTEAYHMGGAYPNPFNPSTQIHLTIARRQQVRVEAYNILGERVAILFEGEVEPRYAQVFTLEGSMLPSGVYLIQATGEYFKVTRSALLLK